MSETLAPVKFTPACGTLLLAWRNLWRSPHRTWLTVGAMIFFNVLLVAMITLQLGMYEMMIETSLKTMSGHLQVQKKGYQDEPRMRDGFAGAARLSRALRRELGLETISARAEGFGLASSAERSIGIRIMGVEPEAEPRVSSLPGLLREGRWLKGMEAEEIVLGASLARNLKLRTGDELTFLGTAIDGSMAAAVVTVVGILETGMTDVDRSLAQLPLGYFQSVFGMPDQAHRLVIQLAALDQVEPARQRLLETLAQRPELVVLDWDALQPGLRQGIEADFVSAWFLYGILILLVSLSVLNTQLMSVLERTREFGVMLALGIAPGRLARLIMLESACMVLLGLALGVLGGGLVAACLAHWGFSVPGMEEAMARFNLPGRIYPPLSLPGLLIGPLALCAGAVLASAYPALRLYWLRPVAAMRSR